MRTLIVDSQAGSKGIVYVDMNEQQKQSMSFLNATTEDKGVRVKRFYISIEISDNNKKQFDFFSGAYWSVLTSFSEFTSEIFIPNELLKIMRDGMMK